MTEDAAQQLLDAMDRDLIAQLDAVRPTNGSAGAGTALERVVAEFLRRLLPRSYDLAPGVVIDSEGGRSEPIDLILSLTDAPAFQAEGIRHVPIEAVAAVIQNRASITSTEALQRAMDAVSSVKALTRVAVPAPIGDAGEDAPPAVDGFAQEALGVIVAGESLERTPFSDHFLEVIRAQDKRLWPNLYCDVREFCGSYMRRPGARTVVPNEAEFFAMTKRTSSDFVPPLLDVAFELLEHLRLRGSDFDPAAYLRRGAGAGLLWKIL